MIVPGDGSAGAALDHGLAGLEAREAGRAAAIAAPLGLRDRVLPLRGRDELLAALADPGPGGV